MPSHNRNNRRQKGNKSQDEDRYPREDDSYSHSRQSDSGYRRYSAGSARNSHDVNVRENSSSSSRVSDSWQQQQQRGDYGQQGRYNSTGKGRKEAYEQAETRERDSGWSTRRSTNDNDFYAHPQREEWPPPPRYDENYSTTSYSDQYSVYQQRSWPEEQDSQLRQFSRNERDSRWPREERPVYAQESDNGWEGRRYNQNQKLGWDEPGSSRFRSPSPVERQWEPAPSWNPSPHRGYEPQLQHPTDYDHQNGQHGHLPTKKNTKRSKKGPSNGKSNGRNRTDGKEPEDFNNWSRRERDIHNNRYEDPPQRKHSRSKSRSRSPAESHYSYRSRRRSPSPPSRASPLDYPYPESPPPPKRRRRNSSQQSASVHSQDYNDRGRRVASPPAERRSSPSPRRRDHNGSSRMSISPASVNSFKDRARSPTPDNYVQAPLPSQRLPGIDSTPVLTASAHHASQEHLPQPEPAVQALPQKSSKNKKKNKRKNAAQLIQSSEATIPAAASQHQPFHNSGQQHLHGSFMVTYQFGTEFLPYQLPPAVNVNGVGGVMPTPMITAPNLSSPSLPQRPPQQPPQTSHHHHTLPQNPYVNQPTDFSEPLTSATLNHRPVTGSFIPIRNARLRAPQSALRQFFPGFNEDEDANAGQPQSRRETQAMSHGESSIQDLETLPANSSDDSAVVNTHHFVPSSSTREPPPSPGPSTLFDKEVRKHPSREPTPATQIEEICAQASEPSHADTPSSIAGAATAAPVSRPDLYSIVGQVGEGTFGKVYKARNTVTNIHVALKRIRMESERDGFPVTAMREIKLLQSLRHDNVVRLYEMMVSSSVYMVFEYMDHDLTGVLSQTQFQFSVAHLKSLCHQMFCGLAYLHHKGIIHRDIKGSNILINNKGELKLADFGLARFYQKRRKADYTNRVITLWYRPPELLLGATVYGPEVDIWSAGCIMLELFTKKPVFQGNDEISQLDVIYKIFGTPSLSRWSGFANLPWYEMVKPKDPIPNRFQDLFRKWMSPGALNLAERLLDFDPTQRVTATQAMETPYFLTEEPKAEKPTSLITLEGEWHELETKRERAKRKKRD
ncbi:hypothetical protein D9757_002769 [Collybiopsis confluens]|uniref:Protein kinase domain-containing protein n=1 Tax=Collybiopsis confluens TaxID=2823264 RepID=A0A8H5HWD9_9AGAR|nr:hypothetical protein D9757_002769 [Collybiopsis confluens]